MRLDSSNAISYRSFCQLGGVRNSHLVKCHRSNRTGSIQYTTYHHIGYGQAYWRNDLI